MPSRLPPHLSERVTAVNAHEPGEGGFVLYWMRVALRGFENPALDAALRMAESLSVPLLVVQGLTERYRYASDRLHHFILEGAWDVADQLAERGIAYRLHVERPGHRPRWLAELTDRAAVVITEDLPIEPLRGWTAGLAAGTSTAVWAVDTANVVPGRIVEGRHTRAFKFRDAIADELDARAGLPWPEVEPEVIAATRAGADAIALPFAPVDLSVDRDALIAECDIDHSVGPVPTTRGGSTAGYARWRRFLTRVRGYARDRNSALKDGVSRMSAYLHFGMVAPTRLAREASAIGGKGGDKYIDELVIWREIANHWCRHHAAHDTLEALPGWARQTLRKHARDPREVIDRESLSRAQSGDDLWDAAQMHLMRHGELHNNVRMTWAKAIPLWTPSPEVAAETLFDLNDRYALDGRDPSSVGGLMWALGLFDRPFKPEIPVLGAVRPRPLDHHARRLDVDAYAEHTARSPYGRVRVAVVGAGLAGSMCARTLQDAGLEVTLFDKGRGAGGRCSTRRSDEGPTWDHGAPAFTLTDRRVGRYARSWRDRGILARWTGGFGTVREGRFTADPDARPQFVGTPGMNHVVKHLQRDLTVHFGSRVTEVTRDGDGVRVSVDDEAVGSFDGVVIAVPAPQAVPLLPDPALAEALSRVVVAPQWTLRVQLSGEPSVDFVQAVVENSPVGLVAREHTKPGRRPDFPAWTVHATPAWSTEHLELEPDAVVPRLIAALGDAVGLDEAMVVHASAHRWRYARVVEPVGEAARLSDDGRIGVCGDAMTGGGVEDALRSGMAMAGRILGRLHTTASQRSSPEGTASGAQLEIAP